MCWSEEVSYAFAAIESLLFGAIWWLPRSRPYARGLTPVAVSVILVEFLEALSWPYVADIDARLRLSLECPVTNAVLTQILIFVVLLQPLAVTHLALRTPPGAEHPRARELSLLRLLSIAFFCAMVAATCATFATDAEDRPHQVDSAGNVIFPYSMVYATTCAYKGPHGHQLWQSAMSSQYQDIFPSSYSYFSIAVASFLCFYDKVEAACWFVFIALFGVFRLLWNAGEAGSMWCWTGILCFTFYLIFPHLKAYVGVPTVTSWWDFVPGKASVDASNASPPSADEVRAESREQV